MSSFIDPPGWQGKQSEVTPEGTYLRRRQLLRNMGLGALGVVGGGLLATGGRPLWAQEGKDPSKQAPAGNEGWYEGLEVPRNQAYEVKERGITPAKLATRYNNFYEFSTDKEMVARLVGDFRVSPWEIEVTGEVEKPGKLDVEKLIRRLGVEERIYRFRCVEAWSMTVPWSGIPMKKLLDEVKPKGTAKYARFWSFERPEQAPGQVRYSWYDWPYYEGFDIAELANELSLLATGIYGKPMPRQNGAPVRVIMPWKYGLKCIKSIVKIEFVRERPPTFWNDLAPDEYSYYSNVEPDVPHPRWSQARERLLDTDEKIDTLPYNGYAAQVAHLYPQKKKK